MIIHTVKNGETIDQIVKEYGINQSDFLADNGIFFGDTLVTGQALVIMMPDVVHTVRRGETLFSIAKQYGIAPVDILRNNYKLGGKDKIRVGETLNITYKKSNNEDADSRNKAKNIMVNSYAYTFIDFDLLRKQVPYLSYFTPFTYGITGDGDIVYPDDLKLRSIAAEYGVKTLLHLSTLTEDGGFDSGRASLLFQNADVSESIQNELTQFAYEQRFGGADVDFEFINPEERYDYIRFLQDLRLKLNPLGLELFSALAPKQSDTQRGTLYEGHDYAGIAAAVNYVLLMTYEWGYTYGPPMAVAPINSVKRVVEYAKTRMSSDKIFMGIPTYGYDWTLPYIQGGEGAKSISPTDAVNLARRYGADIMYDETAKSPWFRYADDDGRLHEVWFEDARSISAKLDLVNNENLVGIGYWNSMRDFPQNWVVLNAKFNITNFGI